MKLPLAKEFNAAEHPRDEDGKFAAGSGGDNKAAPPRLNAAVRSAFGYDHNEQKLLTAAPLPRPAGDPAERRSLMRGSFHRWSNVPGIPIGYTGSPTKEKPIGSFMERKIVEQIPKSVPVEEHQALFGRMKQIIRSDRADAIAHAMTMSKAPATMEQLRDKRLPQPKYRERLNPGPLHSPMVPKDTPRGLLNQAYNHAALAALHDHGILDASKFKMDDALKADLTPLKPFMQHIRKRLLNSINAQEKGSWKPYREEFGQTFADQRRDVRTGLIRRRTSPLQELVKMDMSEDPRTALIHAEHKRACGILRRCQATAPANPRIHPYTARTLPLAQLVLETIGSGGQM